MMVFVLVLSTLKYQIPTQGIEPTALTGTFVKNVKSTGVATGEKYADGQGLCLHVKEAGRYWRMNYRYMGKQKTLVLGVYPEVSLAKARKRRELAREQLADGIDPVTARRSSGRPKPTRRPIGLKLWRGSG